MAYQAYTNRAFLLTGGNLGDRCAHLHKARRLIEQAAGKIVRSSSVYESSPWGQVQQPDYLNQVLILETPLSATALLSQLLQIESQMGRVRGVKYGPRIIDLDILFFNNEIIDLPHLKIPHPRLHRRLFTLLPLLELEPGLVHPIFEKDIRQLVAETEDQAHVKKLVDTAF